MKSLNPKEEAYMKPTTALFALVIAVLLLIASPAFADSGRDTLYQVSTIGALLDGGYDGQEPVSEVLEHGGFGLGTFDRLDGEMVVLDGVCYQIKSDGRAYVVAGELTSPFAAVTFFEPDVTASLEGPVDLDGLKKFIDGMLPDDGLMYAVKVKARFNTVKVRSVKPQHRPYPRLADAVKDQTVFTHEGVSGTLVGFRLPAYVGGGINVPGYHLHFIDDGLSVGGHLLECSIESASVAADSTNRFYMALPEGGLSRPEGGADECDEELDAVEGR